GFFNMGDAAQHRPLFLASILDLQMTSPYKPQFAAVIFDCDGVLVDSEMICAGLLKNMLAEHHVDLSDEMFRHVFLGRSFAHGAERAKSELGFTLPDQFEQQYRERLVVALAQNLKPMPGISEILASLTVPYALATGSSPTRLAISLKVTALDTYFSGRSLTKADVIESKPAPDIYYLAAKRLGVEPAQCLVIEDSENGINAANAAGMQVWHFRGGSHIEPTYRLPPHLTAGASFADMIAVRSAMAKLGLCAA
ncbi:MAG: HAD family phosphatase, partial [Alphaproteobacteria bacterium]|nr:HAD family phosphatase [Alphaproteobacteria bacterium]